MNRRRAFSLIELIVVIGIITILVGILIPAVTLVRENSRSAVCLSNLRELGAGALAYSMANDGCTIPGYAHTGVVVSGNGNLADGENYATLLVNGKYVSAPPLSNINEMVSIKSSVFRCPSGTDDYIFSEFTEASGASGVTTITPSSRKDPLGSRPLRTISDSSGIIVDTWYGINSTLSAGVLTPCRRIPIGSDWSIPRMGHIKSATKMVFLFDGIFYDLNYSADRINARHNFGRNTNVLFFDDHAESIPTNSLPGGFGPTAAGGTDIFTSSSLGTSPSLDWRLDEQ